MGKYRNPIVLFLSGLFALAIGLLFRIMRWPGGHLIVGAMFMVQAFAIVWLVVFAEIEQITACFDGWAKKL